MLNTQATTNTRPSLSEAHKAYREAEHWAERGNTPELWAAYRAARDTYHTIKAESEVPSDAEQWADYAERDQLIHGVIPRNRIRWSSERVRARLADPEGALAYDAAQVAAAAWHRANRWAETTCDGYIVGGVS